MAATAAAITITTNIIITNMARAAAVDMITTIMSMARIVAVAAAGIISITRAASRG